MNESDRKIEFSMRKQKALMTAPLAGYVSEQAREIIQRLENMGFDPDLAFAYTELGLAEEDFYSLPPLNQEETE